ncbi:MAG TPA: outer membrane protein transport protein [Vicinamibacteria bacterium]|nr:outer membrane protein transport protein [Vicinamibacteria bacterium]
MKGTRILRGLVFALGFVLAPAAAHASGFALFEQGAQGMGFAGAFTAQASDPSAIFHNAAGIAFLKGRQLYAGGVLVNPSTDFTGADPFPGEGRLESMSVGIIPFPSAYYTQPVGDALAVGVGIHVPYGLRTEWKFPDVFSGRFISTKAQLSGFSLNPTVAWKVRDRLAIGGGVDIRFSSVELQRSVPAIDPFTQQVADVASVVLQSDTATDFGFNIGVLAKPAESFSIGAAYRHKVKQSYTGDATFTLIPTGSAQFDGLVAQTLPAGAIPATTELETPAIASVGVAYRWNDWTVEGDVNWYGWSAFDEVPITLEGRGDLSTIIREDYDDSFQFRIGVDRRLNDEWSVRGGYFYDPSPSPPESMSPLLPDSDRHGLCAGGSWRRGAFRVDAAAWWLLSQDRSTEGVSRDHYDGIYSSSAGTLGISVGYSF